MKQEIVERLAIVLNKNSDPGKLARLPMCVRSAICYLVASLVKLCEAGRVRDDGEMFIRHYGMPHHCKLLNVVDPPGTYRSWFEAYLSTCNVRMWQDHVFRASWALRSTSCVARGTDDLARKVAEQIEREVNGAKSNGAIFTAAAGGRGRRPSVEASVTYGRLHRRGVVLVDGKDTVDCAAIVKVAEDARNARKVNPGYCWFQPMLVLPANVDVRSDRLLELAFERHVVLATTVLPTWPLGLAI